MISHPDDIAGMKVTVMGLGLHGGGVASARFFASHGAEVTATDLRDENTLAESIAALQEYPVRFVLGAHEMEDFREADLVIKNPAVPPDSPYLAAAPVAENDISIFLRLSRRPVIAVTGSKGKSTTASALAYALSSRYPESRLGGNITVSPLSFVESCLEPSEDPVVLELSSWQLADLPDISLLEARISIVTNLLHDHQDKYPDMESYADDKKRIFASQTEDDSCICNFDDPFGRRFAVTTPATPYFFSAENFSSVFDGAYLENGEGFVRLDGKTERCVPENPALPGPHNKLNLLAAALALRLYGLEADSVGESLAAFPGIEHRLELVREVDGLRWYNDSAATIPEATAAAIESFSGPLHLIAGGTDKRLDFELLRPAAGKVDMYHLLEGSATVKLRSLLDEMELPYRGPFSSLQETVESARMEARPGSVVLFSPASASFGMFHNEFDRGRKFKELIEKL